LNSSSKDEFNGVNFEWGLLMEKPYVASVAEFSTFTDFEVQLLIIRMGYISLHFRGKNFTKKAYSSE